MNVFRPALLYLILTLFSCVRAQGLPPPERNRLFREMQKVPVHVAQQEYQEALRILNQSLPMLRGLMAEDPALRLAYAFGLYTQGLCQLETEDYGTAEETLLQFLQGYPGHPNAMKARLLLGECYLYQENWEGILKAIPAVVNSNLLPVAEKAFGHQLLAEANFQLERWEAAKPHLGWLFQNVQNPEVRLGAASQLAVCMIRLREFRELYEVMPRLHLTDAKYDIDLNLTVLDEGDNFLKDDRPDLALLMFRMVVPYSQLEAKLNERTKVAEKRLRDLRRVSADTQGSMNKQVRATERLLEELQAEAADLKDYPDYDLELRIRLGDVYYTLERWEEAIQLYLSIYERDPDSEIAERAMYSAYMTAFQAEEKIRAWEIAQKYMASYPGGEFWDDVTLHSAGLLISLERWEETENLIVKALDVSPNHVMKDNMLYMKGYVMFMQSKLKGAIQTMDQVLNDFPNSTYQIPARYWKAMGHLFLQEYPEAREEFNRVVTTAQGGILREDSFYRMGVATYGMGDFPLAQSTLEEFLTEYPDSHLASEAHAMIGDILASETRLDDAIARYQRAVDTAHLQDDGTYNMVQVDYATFQQARTYELESRWQEIIDLFDRYQARFADHNANYTESTYWKGNALKQLGKEDEALQLFYDTIVTHGNATDAYGIDFMLRDLAEELGNMPADQALAIECKERLNQELDLAIQQQKQTLLLRLRTLQYLTTGNTEVKEMVKQTLLQAENIPLAAPFTLDVMGQIAAENGRTDLARAVYEHFLDTFEDSDLILHALVGLSENRIEERRYEEAIRLLQSITDRFPTLPQAAESYLRLGDVYRLTGEPTQAIEMYTLILTVKEWRGDPWPRALLKIGDAHAEMKEWDKAFGFYQRVYLMYVGYAEYAAEAYYKSALMLAELNRPGEAKKTLEEMLENENLAGQAVASDARLMILRLP